MKYSILADFIDNKFRYNTYPEILTPIYFYGFPTWKDARFKFCLSCGYKGQLSCYAGEQYYPRVKLFGFCFYCLDEREIPDRDYHLAYHYPEALIPTLKKSIAFRKELKKKI